MATPELDSEIAELKLINAWREKMGLIPYMIGDRDRLAKIHACGRDSKKSCFHGVYCGNSMDELVADQMEDFIRIFGRRS